ncbi:MAG TPA: type IV toxin-antitoxin system AbiEi family antitoxin domain-containing protein [Acidimicrobiales bacterium]|nr:type IV toxin-antitoxin system AbiEi family antitoxin domain-containing protein [Acidimicrobiales bacterium]
MDADLTIARLAATQHGVAARKQLLGAGVSPHVVQHRVAKGLLVPVHAGVYRLAGTAETWHQRIMAATVAAGPGAVASHRAAAFLHGLEGVEPQPEVTVTRHRAPRPQGVVVHRLASLRPGDTEVCDGIPRTRPPATLLALAAVVPARPLEIALDDALRRGLVSCAHLLRRLDHAARSGRPGVAVLRELLAARLERPRWLQSEFERRLFALLRTADLPLPVPQFEVRLPGGRKAFLDFAWPAVRLALEADSYRHHASRLDWSRDRTRNNLVISLGWRVLPVTWEDMVDKPDELRTTVFRAHFSGSGPQKGAKNRSTPPCDHDVRVWAGRCGSA